jgi:hypothetical protein
MCRNLRPKAAEYWGMEANFVSFLARNRCKPPMTRLQFRAWARALGVPIAAYDNRAWRERIPDVATQLIFGGSPGPSERQSMRRRTCSGVEVPPAISRNRAET